MELSLRLKKIADQVPKCILAVDIGTDHAFVPIYLVKNSVAEKVVASDISGGSVEKARRNVSFASLADRIDCRLGDGLSVISEKEKADVIIAAGMGGMLMIHTLETNMRVFLAAKRLILQPQKDNGKVRRFVHNNGFKIILDDFFEDDGRVYNVIVCEHGEEPHFSDDEYIFGKISLETKNPVLAEFIRKEMNRMENIENNLLRDGERSANRRKELSALRETYGRLLNGFNS